MKTRRKHYTRKSCKKEKITKNLEHDDDEIGITGLNEGTDEQNTQTTGVKDIKIEMNEMKEGVKSNMDKKNCDDKINQEVIENSIGLEIEVNTNYERADEINDVIREGEMEETISGVNERNKSTQNEINPAGNWFSKS